MILYGATTNPGKLREFRLAAERLGPDGITIEALPGLNRIQAPEENGATFEANAIIKATYYSEFTGGLLFADDSGLEVTALAGAPGVHSARFAGPAATDATNNALLLDRLRGVTNRAGRFVCVIAVAQRGKLVETFRGEVQGQIADAPRGTNGFGYDPLFFYPPFGCTFGESDLDRKMKVSHRARAVDAMLKYFSSAGTGCHSMG
ncbi:MAG TPA: RdgB/HAM1 family non-canonical purine NTP pyrophosphatase [Bryobacteraceae bacterium]|nr:RdgB/HAM1 family non-canonical purine NTP pyrophosphatase [Bryobacteraceae bacterium]